MQVIPITSLFEWKRLAGDWNGLAGGVPFRRWEWLYSWWQHYSDHRKLFVLSVRDGDELVGAAPWFIERRPTSGRVVRFLGSGEVCSDYQTVLAADGKTTEVTAALAQWLTRATASDQHRWDRLELTGADADDRAMSELVGQLQQQGNTVHCQAGQNCWRIELPSCWDDYMTLLSKSHRKQIRRIERRMVETGRVRLQTVDGPEDLRLGLDLFADLHKRRRRSLGDGGCFASKAFTGFLHETAAQLLKAGQLQLCWLELDAKPIAAEFQIVSDGVTYAYQSGVHPDYLDDEPGRMINIATIRRAIDRGHRAFDFLRGDEPYKAHWRADPHPSVEYRVVPQRAMAQVRHGVWLAGDRVKKLIKAGLSFAGRA